MAQPVACCSLFSGSGPYATSSAGVCRRSHITTAKSTDSASWRITPGPTLFHCHQKLHMDFGFMALFEYA